jgi:two-component system sensor histidine kinase CpxA
VSVDALLHAEADEQYLLRAIANLLRNAIRYAGAAGPVRIDATAEGGSVAIAVTDSGPGVPKADLESIFAPFYRTDTSRNAQTGGVGLGLAIVRNSVESCGGTVRATNVQPSGLRVEIRLPEASAKL